MCSTESRIKTVMNEISDYGSEFKKEIRGLFSKGVAYDQVRWERDVAISQLNDLGIEFGESVERYKYAIKNFQRFESDAVKYTTCNTEWGLDARYVCPECLCPVEKEHKFCPHCGKALNWFNAPHATDELKNKFIAASQNGVRMILENTSSKCYRVENYRKNITDIKRGKK